MPEIKINQTTRQKDKVYFRGTANLSDKEAESFNKANEKPVEAEVNKPAQKKGK